MKHFLLTTIAAVGVDCLLRVPGKQPSSGLPEVQVEQETGY